MTTLRPASLLELRTVLQQALAPDRLQLFRRGTGQVHLRVLSPAFEGVNEPLDLVEAALGAKGLRLPDGVMTLLRAPSELEDEDWALFEPPPLETPTWPAALEAEATGAQAPDDRGLGDARVIAFWGLKGGVGRTTSLAHVATFFGQQGRRVLAIDLDLDAPGLVAVLGQPLPPGASIDEELRFDQLLIDAQDSGMKDDALRARLERALRPARGDLPRVDLLGPELADARFVRNLLGPLHPDRLYRGAQPALRRLLRLAVQASQADLVLLDARSGYCEESALSVLDLADQVVVFASPTPRTFDSLAPAFDALERRAQLAGRPTMLHVVAGMLPAGREARDRILTSLPISYLEARQEIYDALQGRLVLLPEDLSVIPISYAGVVVENAGGLGLGLESVGYSELAERIQESLWPTVQEPPVATPSLEAILKEVDLHVPAAEQEGNLAHLLELFTRTPDSETLLRRNRTLVLGAKGTGKTYLRRVCLEEPGLLGAPKKMRFIDAYSIPRDARPGAQPVSQEMMAAMDRRADQLGWKNLWSAIAACRALTELPAYADPSDPPALRRACAPISAAERVEALCEAAADPLALDGVWARLDERLRQQGEEMVLLFDDLDVVLGRSRADESRRAGMLVGLLDRVMSSWLTRSALSAKVFLRDDLLRGLALQDRSKLEQNPVRLKWRPEDIWRMLIRAMAVGSPPFKERLSSYDIDLKNLETLGQEQLQEQLAFLWGHRMGGSSGATRTLSWVERRLTDGTGRLFPRAALWLLDKSIEEQRRRGAPTAPPLLSPPALRNALPEVAGLRLGELENESTEAEWQQILRLSGCSSFMPKGELLEHLRQNGEAAPDEALETLKALGIVELVEKQDQVSVRIVDLYAFAPDLRINRLGRR